jgi:chemosensory pili system protein ChpA (sensor histidine kinase/response regulator)
MRPVDMTAIAAFSDEVRSSIPAILAALDEAERDRTGPASQEAFRLIHALKGAASMVGLAALGHLLNHAEALLDHVVSDGVPLSDELIAALRATTPRLDDYLTCALAGASVDDVAMEFLAAFLPLTNETLGRPGEPTLAELLEIERSGLAAMPPPQPDIVGPAAEPLPPVPVVAVEIDFDPMPSDPIPAELAEVFSQEAQEHLQTISRITRHLASAPDDREALQELRRAVHTIKGAAGVVGYRGASRLAHRMEDLLDRLYEGTAELTADAVRLLASSYDALDDLIGGGLDAAAARATIGRLFAQFDANGAAQPAARDAAGAGPTDAFPTPMVQPAAPSDERRRQSPDRRRNVEDRRAGAQIVRVPFQRVGELVRLISELVVNRSLFDEHYASLIRQVEEVKLSTQRLRRVALKLETDYEVRALAGNVAPASAGSHAQGFDELEFDRYTDFHLLSRELAETATDISTINSRLSETIGDFDGDLTRLGRLTREVQDKVMEFRMVPLATLASRLERAVRVTAEACGKDAELVLEGEHVALDKTMLDAMSDPLLHILRNAVDHGIETPAARAAAGKPRRGRIAVRAAHEGTDVVIEIEDDGAGLDLERIRRTAIERGDLSEADAAAAGADELYAFVLQPGFSTAERISEVSGRGVGLDIVKAKVTRLGGRIALSSTPGAGTRITIRVPMTLAITRILLVRAGQELMGIPLGAVLQIVRADAASITTVGSERVIQVSGRTYPLRDLAGTLGLTRAGTPNAAMPVLVANLGGRHVALAVDEIVQSRDAVVKTLGSHLRRVPGIWGATLLGDGTVILILNPADLAGSAEEPRAAPIAPRRPAAVAHAPYTVLVVDDSLSMRHVLSNAVKKAGWNPLQARDGVEALEMLTRATAPPDLILLDIEMPRMDGYEFLSTVRAQSAYTRLPIVMLTSRGGDKHRDKAISLGASGYVVKPFQEESLLRDIDRLVRASRSVPAKAAS